MRTIKTIIGAVLLTGFSMLAVAQTTSNINTVSNTTTDYTSTNTSTNTNVNTNNTNTVSTSTTSNTNNNNNVSTSTSSNVNMNINDSSMTSESVNRNINSSTSTNINDSTVTQTNTNNNVNQSTSDSNSTSYNENLSRTMSSQQMDQTIHSPPPSAIAPSIGSSYSQDLCTTGISGAVQTQIFGISAGKSVTDTNCERIKLSKTLYDMGMRVAAVSLMCQDERVWTAMKMAGTPCPYEGKIGQEASIAWETNRDQVPGYDEKKDKANTPNMPRRK